MLWLWWRRLKDKKKAAGMATANARPTLSIGRRGLMESTGNKIVAAKSGSEHGFGSGSCSSQFGNEDGIPMVPVRYYESPRAIVERRVIACVEAQLVEPLRERWSNSRDEV